MANHGGNNSSSRHDHCWPSKMQDWHLKSPWDWKVAQGFTVRPRIGMRDYSWLNGFVQKRVIILGRSYSMGRTWFMSPRPCLSLSWLTGNFTEVINDGSFSGNHKAQFSLDVKIHQNPLAEGSVKSEGNGLLKGWLVEGVANGGNFLGGSEYRHSVREIWW